MKVDGTIHNQPVRILLDSGSTHNFVDYMLVRKLGWPLQATKPFDVMIADRGKVRSQGCCKNLSLELGGYHCHIDLFALPLGGCDVVLVVQWHSSVGPVLWDFQLLTMEFHVGTNSYKLYHSAPPYPLVDDMVVQNLEKELSGSNLGVLLYSVDKVYLPDNTTLTTSQQEELQAILDEFEAVFLIHTHMPPAREHDHRIPLIAGARPL
ncbi:uncharacterized protein [Pyrus communis]|uniref:uncharacterized protein n=1 Tax=Pyrus communis TaxID=23211 RepID=UPI0035C1087E